MFGHKMKYIPASSEFTAFGIVGDFHRDYQQVKDDMLNEASITSSFITVFIREVSMPAKYPKPKQGDYIQMSDEKLYQIMDIRHYIPSCLQLVLHEEG